MASNTTSWNYLPPEIRNQIIHLLPTVGGKCSELVTICKDWQAIIEPRNFAEISLTVPRLTDPDSRAILFQRRSQIRHIWFRVELKQYDCRQCAPSLLDRDAELHATDNGFIVDAFESLFTALSPWEPRGDLVLDISVYSPSDNQHWFKYLSFCPDTNQTECPSRHGHEQGSTPNDPAHGWVAGRQVFAPDTRAIEATFEEIMDEGPFRDKESEMQWWRSLPSVPVVGVVFLRQQTRRRWNPIALASNKTLIESFSSTALRKIMIFENFNEAYPEIYDYSPDLRVPNEEVGQRFARASLHLLMLSASFIADAGDFFEACQSQSSWTWERLTSLALTSRVLINDPAPLDVDKLLCDAAAAALRMPRLKIMELWNGRQGVAMLFRYQRAQDGQPAIITVRGTSELVLGRTVMLAWEVVARQHCHCKIVVQSSSIDPDEIRCHGDAIRQLGLLTEVVRSVSLEQILSEDRFRAGDHHYDHQHQHAEELVK